MSVLQGVASPYGKPIRLVIQWLFILVVC